MTREKMKSFINQMVEEISNSTAPWQKPWNEGEILELPRNHTTGKDYQGANLLQLLEQGYNDPRWMTYNQAIDRGLHVRRGEQSTPAFYFSPRQLVKERDDKGNLVMDPETGTPKEKEINKPILSSFAVFNGSQIEGLEPYAQMPPSWQPDQKAEELIDSFRGEVQIVESRRDRAFYAPDRHVIELPDKSNFPDSSEYYSTLFHELAHSTKHPHMLNRTHEPGKEGRAKEELRAEIAAWLICTQVGVGYSPEAATNNAAYISGWLGKLPEGTRDRELMSAIKDAEKIGEFVLSRDKELKLFKEQTAVSLPLPEKTYLNVPFEEKNEAKELGARWDRGAKRWYVPEDLDTDKFTKWLDDKAQNKETYIISSVDGVGLTKAGTLDASIFHDQEKLQKFDSPKEALTAALAAKQTIKDLDKDDDLEVLKLDDGEIDKEPIYSTRNYVPSAAVKIDEASWKLGHQDGKAGTKEHEQKAHSGFSYSSGWIEGDAVREFSVTKQQETPGEERTYINVPFEEKNEAKELGAQWDPKEKSWFIPEGVEKDNFSRWLDGGKQQPQAPAATFDMAEVERQMREKADSLGLRVDQLVMDGKMHRTPVEGDKANQKSGAYVIYPDGRPAGFIQNHKTGEKINVKYEGELEEFITGKEHSREKEREDGYQKAAKTAFGIYINAEKAPHDHPYLKAKNIQPEEGVRLDKSGRLIIPLMNPKTKKIESLQFIGEDGSKMLLRGGKKSGNCHIIGELDEKKPMLLCEGYATGKSLENIANLPAIVCFDAGNMENVAHSIKELMPSAEIFVCADNDHAKSKNVGLEKARRVAKAIGGEVIVPEFNDQQKKQGLTDFNDLANSKFGKTRVLKALEKKIPYLAKKKSRDQGEELAIA